jgi:RHS repeat-associated protein
VLHQGGLYDVVTGLYAFRHREASPALGRWVQQDPIGFEGGINLYESALNNPLFFSDPLGTIDIPPIFTISIGDGRIGGNLPKVTDPIVQMQGCKGLKQGILDLINSIRNRIAELEEMSYTDPKRPGHITRTNGEKKLLEELEKLYNKRNCENEEGPCPQLKPKPKPQPQKPEGGLVSDPLPLILIAAPFVGARLIGDEIGSWIRPKEVLVTRPAQTPGMPINPWTLNPTVMGVCRIRYEFHKAAIVAGHEMHDLLSTSFDADPSAWMSQFRRLDDSTMSSVIYDLAFGQSEETPAKLQILLCCLQEERLSIRKEAAWAISELSSNAGDFAPAIAAALNDSDSEVKRWVLTALRRIGFQARSTVNDIVHFVRIENDPLLRIKAYEALLAILKRIAFHKDNSGASAYIWPKDSKVIGCATDPATRFIREVLQNRSYSSVQLAVAAQDPVMRRMGVLCYVLVKPIDPQDFQKLLHSLDDDVLCIIALIVGDLVANPEVVFMDLFLRCAGLVKRVALTGMRKVEVVDLGFLPTLTEALLNDDNVIRANACYILGDMGSKASVAALPLVRLLLSSKNENEVWNAGMALCSIGCPSEEAIDQVAKMLGEALNNEKLNIRCWAARILDACSKTAELQVPALGHACAADQEVAFWAAAALGKIGLAAIPAIPALVRCLHHCDSSIRWCAAKSLGMIGCTCPEVVYGLRQLLMDVDYDVRFHAANSLVMLESNPAQDAIGVLCSFRDDPKRHAELSERSRVALKKWGI